MALTLYNKKRNFKETSEPVGKTSKEAKLRFVVQRHHASHIHYDFRLEMDGVLKSWAVPKGPSLNPSVKRLAMLVEDHPVSYISFEGTIPKGNYGAGTVEVWDDGGYIPVDEKGGLITEKKAMVAFKNGNLKFELNGKKLKGGFALVRLKNDDGKSWLLIKHRDKYAVDEDYNSEDYSKNKKKEDKAGIVKTTTKNIKKKPDTVLEKKAERNNNSKGSTEKKEANNITLVVEKKKLELTNLNKIFWPKEGFTKGDVIGYYDGIAAYILPYLKNRPLSLKRNPNGLKDEGFYHKDAGDSAPSWVKKADLHSESANKIIRYIVCNDKATLLYLANLGCIEMNPWNSTTVSLQKPSYFVIDIDPSDKNNFNQVIETAVVTKEVLAKAGINAHCKTSGATGIHVYVPTGSKYNYDLIKNFAQIVATLVQEQLPAFTSLERNLQKRGNKIYIDYLQNRTGQTLASAYSLRPKEGATVSTPLDWKEVKPGLLPSDFTMNTILHRLKKKGDLFSSVLGKGIDIAKSIKKLEQ